MVLSQMWWINYLLLQLYLDILHRYEPTDYADNNLQCRHGPFPCMFGMEFQNCKYNLNTGYIRDTLLQIFFKEESIDRRLAIANFR